MKSRLFVDSVAIRAKSGDGGNGITSFRREKCVPKGGPDGGDGGKGGHVILRAHKDVTSLIHLHYAPEQYAKNAEHGKGKQQHGKNGKDLIIKVPCGTEVRDEETGELLADLVDHNSEFMALCGGKGGRGNIHWKTSTNRAPRQHSDGEPGKLATLRLDLKLVADIGLVGFPNAGKSSLLSKLTYAHPKIAAYPFTTLNPIIGTMSLTNHLTTTIADIPGLIENAHKGAGLGHAFLRHIERSSCLIFVIDMSGMDGKLPWDNYLNLQEELRLHKQDILDKPSIIVANKMDLPESKNNLTKFRKKTNTSPAAVSALTGEGVLKLKRLIEKLCAKN